MSRHERDEFDKALNDMLGSAKEEFRYAIPSKWSFGKATIDALRITEEGGFVYEFTIPSDSPTITFEKMNAEGRLLLDLHRIAHEEVYGLPLIVQDWSTEHLEDEPSEDEKKG